MSFEASRFYQQKSDESRKEIKTLKYRLKGFAWYRFAAFSLIFLPVFVFGAKNVVSWVVSITALVVFFFLVKKNIQLENKKKRQDVRKQIADEELLALGHSFSHFKTGEKYLDIHHRFAYDLDIFGEGSLFQFVDRTVTQGGEKTLAGWLLSPPLSGKEIHLRQEAVRELAQLPDWGLDFRVNGKLFNETAKIHSEIESWAEKEIMLKNPGLIRWLMNLLPALTILSIIPAALGFTNSWLFLFVFIQWVLIFIVFWKKINEFNRFFGRKSGLLEKYRSLLCQIEESHVQSGYLAALWNKLAGEHSAGKRTGELLKIVNRFGYRENLLVGFLLNSVLLWDIRCVYRLWKWHAENRRHLPGWLDALASFDALISLANFAANHSDYVYPEIREDNFVFSAQNLGHPLLHPGKRVGNDLEISGWSKVMIITGANMAGKSTFLRTVGVNLLLAGLGAPVCATKMVFTPVGIYTNMRTTDSLYNDESYFFAELKRIQSILKCLEKGERLFIIMDEMLKGTNSVDKLNGSVKLVRKLVQFEAVSLIATHDLKLSEMEKEFPDNVFNRCFEIRIENNELVFDYRLSEGVTQTMNASFLMKKMGIIQ